MANRLESLLDPHLTTGFRARVQIHALVLFRRGSSQGQRLPRSRWLRSPLSIILLEGPRIWI